MDAQKLFKTVESAPRSDRLRAKGAKPQNKTERFICHTVVVWYMTKWVRISARIPGEYVTAMQDDVNQSWYANQSEAIRDALKLLYPNVLKKVN